MWSNQYIGIPYKAGGRDRSGLDCWGLARLVYQEQYKINLPSFSTEYTENDTTRMSDLIAQYREGWTQNDTPQEGDLVLLRVLGSESHIGVVIDGNSFLHIREGSDACVEKLNSGSWRNRIVGYFKYTPKKGALVNALPHPLKTERVTLPIPSGININTLILWISKEYDVPVELTPNIVVFINGKPVDPIYWETTYIENGDAVEYRVVAGKDAVRAVAFIALAIYAPYLAGQLTGYTAAASAATIMGASVTTSLVVANAVVTAGLVLAGSALINAIAPIRPPTAPTDPGQAERMYMFEGSTNQRRLYDSIPVILGKVRMTPPLGANNFTYYKTEREQYLRMLLVWGYGPLVIDESTLKIGDTAYSSYSDKEIVTLNRITEPTTAQQASFDRLYGSDVEQLYKNITLTAVGTDIANPPAPGIDYIGDNFVVSTFDTVGANTCSVTIHFPEGLRKVNKQSGDSSVTNVKFRIETSINGGVTWINGNNYYIATYIGSDIYRKDAFSVSIDLTSITTTATGIVSIRVRRDTSSSKEDSSYSYYYTSVLQSVQKTLNTKPTIDPVGVKVAKSALEVKATGQLSGQIEGISAIVQTYARTWNGVNWNTLAATSNPAALFLYVVTHPGNIQNIAPYSTDEADRVDLAALGYWYNYCQTKGFEFNSIVGSQRSLLDVLRDICAAGRASPAIVNGKWTVNIDETKDIIAQHFSPHNSWGFESTKLLPKIPDGVKVKFFDQDLNYEENEVTVYNNGKTYETATVFESITLPGVTKKSLVIDHAKWQLSQAKVRPEVYSLNTDLEYLVCTRGDRVKVMHDVPMWGLGSGRIKNRISSSLFELDEPISIQDTSLTHILRIRGKLNSTITATIKSTWTVTQYQKTNNIVTLTLSGVQHPFKVGDQFTSNVGNANINITNGTVTAVTATTISYQKTGTNIGLTAVAGSVLLTASNYSKVEFTTTLTQNQADAADLFLFGQNELEAQDLIVLSVEPTSNKSAKLTLVDYGVTPRYNLFTDYSSIIDTSDIKYNYYSINNNIVTLTTMVPHGILVADKITVPPRGTPIGLDSTLAATNVTVVAVSSNTVSYTKTGLTNTGSTVSMGVYIASIQLVSGGFFESQISGLPYNYSNSITKATPVISSIVSDESVLEVVGPGSFIVRTVVNIVPQAQNNQLPPNLEHVEVAYDLINGSYTAGSGLVRGKFVDGFVSIPNLSEGTTYRLKARFVNTDGAIGPWSAESAHTVIGKTTVPATVTGLSIQSSQTSTDVILKWTPNTEKDIFGYEIRTSNASWGATGYLWKGQATQATIPISSLASLTTTFFIKALDYNKNYSTTAASLQFARSRPLAPANLNYAYGTATTSAFNVLDISWSAASVPINGLAIKHYLVTITKPATGGGTTIPQFIVAGTTTSVIADWVGDATISVTSVDILNQTSVSPVTATIGKLAPSPLQNPYASVIDNNVLLYWTLPPKTSMPITAVNVRRGATFATSELIGAKSGGFTSLFELAAGTYTYWLTAVDSDNRESSAVPVTVTVSQPPDYVFNNLLTSDFATNATKVSCTTITGNTGNGLLMLVNSTESWTQHFTGNSVDQIQDFINAGYQYYVQPASGIVSSSFTQIFDLGAVLPSSSVTVSYLKELIIGNPAVSVQIATGIGSNINSVTWSPLASTNSIFATNFKYVKVVITATETAAADLVLIRDLTIRLDSKLKNDAGYITASQSDVQGTIVNFNTNNTFVDITSITVTPNSTTPLVTVYDFKDATLSGTYTIIGPLGTITVPNHGLITGQRVRLVFTTGGAATGSASGVYAITKIDDNTYTINVPGAVGGVGGDVYAYPQSMRIYVYDLAGVRQDCPQVSWAVKGY
jgi:hypothetical protein